MSSQSDPKFPIGKFVFQEEYTSGEVENFIQIISRSPAAYRSLTSDLQEDDLLRVYREGSWNVRQLVHHVADIQLLHYFRMKKAVTEEDRQETALIDMNAWARTPDSLEAPVADSLMMFEGITRRYMAFAGSLTPEQFSKTYFHKVRQLWFSQYHGLAISAWHVQHHLAHIRIALGLPV